MDYFYDGQVKRYLGQFMRIMSNFSYKDARGQLTRVPVLYGDMNRMVSQILRKNTENTVPSAPYIACYIKDLQYDRPRVQDPSFVGKIHIRERAFDEAENEYLINQQGANYTVERLMPVPYVADFAADIWCTNTDQKLQIWEQISVLFNPSLEIQTTDNYIDWTSLSTLTIKSQTWTSRSVPQGLDQDIDILTLIFETPIWITPPVKVKKLGIITKILANIYPNTAGTVASEYRETDAVLESLGSENEVVVVTPGEFDLLVVNNVGTLIANNPSSQSMVDLSTPGNNKSWRQILDMYPGTFRAGLSQIRLMKADGNEIVAYISMDPLDDSRMLLNIDSDTIPTNTIISGRGTVDAIIDPERFNPGAKATGIRYLILEDINQNNKFGIIGYDGPDAWKNADNSDFQAHANDIIEWDGSQWNIVFDSTIQTDIVYITNAYTGVQYKWTEGAWSKSFEGIYDKSLWRLIL